MREETIKLIKCYKELDQARAEIKEMKIQKKNEFWVGFAVGGLVVTTICFIFIL